MKPLTLSEFDIQRIARALADSPRIRLINQKLDIIMENQQTDQQVLDEIVTDLNDAETQLATEINNLEAQVAAIPLTPGATHVDFTALRSAVAKYKSLVPIPVGTAQTTPAPAVPPPAVDTPAAPTTPVAPPAVDPVPTPAPAPVTPATPAPADAPLAPTPAPVAEPLP